MQFFMHQINNEISLERVYGMPFVTKKRRCVNLEKVYTMSCKIITNN